MEEASSDLASVEPATERGPSRVVALLSSHRSTGASPVVARMGGRPASCQSWPRWGKPSGGLAVCEGHSRVERLSPNGAFHMWYVPLGGLPEATRFAGGASLQADRVNAPATRRERNGPCCSIDLTLSRRSARTRHAVSPSRRKLDPARLSQEGLDLSSLEASALPLDADLEPSFGPKAVAAAIAP